MAWGGRGSPPRAPALCPQRVLATALCGCKGAGPLLCSCSLEPGAASAPAASCPAPPPAPGCQAGAAALWDGGSPWFDGDTCMDPGCLGGGRLPGPPHGGRSELGWAASWGLTRAPHAPGAQASPGSPPPWHCPAATRRWALAGLAAAPLRGRASGVGWAGLDCPAGAGLGWALCHAVSSPCSPMRSRSRRRSQSQSQSHGQLQPGRPAPRARGAGLPASLRGCAGAIQRYPAPPGAGARSSGSARSFP